MSRRAADLSLSGSCAERVEGRRAEGTRRKADESAALTIEERWRWCRPVDGDAVRAGDGLETEMVGELGVGEERRDSPADDECQRTWLPQSKRGRKTHRTRARRCRWPRATGRGRRGRATRRRQSRSPRRGNSLALPRRALRLLRADRVASRTRCSVCSARGARRRLTVQRSGGTRGSGTGGRAGTTG